MCEVRQTAWRRQVFNGIGEMRIDHGPGYRVYFTKRGAAIIILLCGGDKGSQVRDNRKAMEMVENLE